MYVMRGVKKCPKARKSVVVSMRRRETGVSRILYTTRVAKGAGSEISRLVL